MGVGQSVGDLTIKGVKLCARVVDCSKGKSLGCRDVGGNGGGSVGWCGEPLLEMSRNC